MSYTYAQFKKQYPSDDVCLDEIFQNRFGGLTACPECGVVGAKFYRIKKRKCYSCTHCGHQINPLSGTIFHKSETPLTNWFFAIFLMGNSKNSVSAKELERHFGCTYKTAWRMAKQIRLLMAQGDDKLVGIVEADETYIGGRRHRNDPRGDNKTPVIGLVERGGHAKAKVSDATATEVLLFIAQCLDDEADLHTDESRIYSRVSRYRVHEVINHSKEEYARGHVTTNSVEGFWSQMKRSLDGSHHAVSPKYLQSYVNYFVHSYNHRNETVFPILMAKAAKPVQLAS